MSTVVVTGWRPGFNKVQMTALLRDALGLGLAAAKQVTDRVLAGERVELAVSAVEAAERLALALRKLGVNVTVLTPSTAPR